MSNRRPWAKKCPIVGTGNDFVPSGTRLKARREIARDAMDDATQGSAKGPRFPGSVSNIGEPLRLKNVEPLAGFAAEVGRPGQVVKVVTRQKAPSDRDGAD